MGSLVLGACQATNPGGGDGGAIATVSLSPAVATAAVGATATFTAVAKDAHGDMIQTPFTWSSSDTGVATVRDGVATALAPGTARIRALAAGVASEPATLTVTAGDGDGGDGGDGGSAAANAFLLPHTPGGEAINVSETTLAVDARGGVHAAYYDLTGDPAIDYFYCPANCDGTSDFVGGTVAAPASAPEFLNLVLDAYGHPRLLWTQYHGLVYGACDDGCTDPANWDFVIAGDLVDLNSGSNRELALDPLGHPRFLYTDDNDQHRGTFLTACDTACLTAGNWITTKVSGTLFTRPSLTVGSDGLPRFVFVDENGEFAYIACSAADCATWTGLDFFPLSHFYSDFSLRLDAQDHPRLALYTGPGAGGVLAAETVYYLACDVLCADQANNDWQAVGLVDGQTGYQNVALVLDAQDHPRLAVTTDEGMNVAGCDSGCAGATDGWSMALLDGEDALDAEEPVTPPTGCAEIGWSVGGAVSGTGLSIGLDPSGEPRLGYDIRNLVTCSGHVETSIVWPRFATLTLP